MNHKMILINVAQNYILYYHVNYQPVLKKFRHPSKYLKGTNYEKRGLNCLKLLAVFYIGDLRCFKVQFGPKKSGSRCFSWSGSQGSHMEHIFTSFCFKFMRTHKETAVDISFFSVY